MPCQLPIDYPGAIHHVMSRGDRREIIYMDDVDRLDFLKTLAKLAGLGWKEEDLERRRKNDPGKLAIAARLRKETVLSTKSISARVYLGSYNTAAANLRSGMR